MALHTTLQSVRQFSLVPPKEEMWTTTKIDNRLRSWHPTICNVKESWCHLQFEAFLRQSSCSCVQSVLRPHIRPIACEGIPIRQSHKHCSMQHSQLASRLLQFFVCRHVCIQPWTSPKSPEYCGMLCRPPANVRPHHTNTQGVTLAAGVSKSNFQDGDTSLHGSINWAITLLGTTNFVPHPKLWPSFGIRWTLVVQLTKTSLGDKAFSHTAPSIWNSLPLSIRQCKTLLPFRKHLKKYLFLILNLTLNPNLVPRSYDRP